MDLVGFGVRLGILELGDVGGLGIVQQVSVFWLVLARVS